MGESVKLSPRVVAIPSDRVWFDPALILAATEATPSTVVVPAGVVTLLLGEDPARVSLVVSANSQCRIGPWSDINLYPYWNANPSDAVVGYTDQHFQAKLFDQFAVACYAWYAFSVGGATVRVVSIRRK